MDEYRKLCFTTVFISREKIEEFKIFIQDLGLPNIIADDEAENLASSLCVEGIVSCVWSADTDTLPLGASLVGKGFDKVDNKICLDTICIKKALEKLEWTEEEFRDFCILLGTDFNDNLAGIGPSKAQILINKYRNLETVESSTKHNCYGLKYKEVRGQLTCYKTKYNKEDLKINKEIDKDSIEEKYREIINLQSFLNLVVYSIDIE